MLKAHNITIPNKHLVLGKKKNKQKNLKDIDLFFSGQFISVSRFFATQPHHRTASKKLPERS